MTVTTIQISSETRDRLKTFGIKSESYDEILTRLMDYFVSGDVKIKADYAGRFLAAVGTSKWEEEDVKRFLEFYMIGRKAMMKSEEEKNEVMKPSEAHRRQKK